MEVWKILKLWAIKFLPKSAISRIISFVPNPFTFTYHGVDLLDVVGQTKNLECQRI
jgi:hypothetical protein